MSVSVSLMWRSIRSGRAASVSGWAISPIDTPDGWFSASDRGVLELVEVGPAGEQVDGALDGGLRDRGVALGAVHEPDEHGPVVGDEGGDAPHLVVGRGPLVLLAERLQRPAFLDGVEDGRRVDPLLFEDASQDALLADVAALVVAGGEQRLVDLQELLL